MDAKKILSKSFISVIVCPLAFLFSLIFLSCGEDSGLGASVDTEAPKLSISYPPAAAAVRGTFVLAGTCSDDKVVDRVIVTTKNLDTGTSYGSASAEVKDSLTWSISLNKYDSADSAYINGWELPDGKYQFDVVAYDKSGRTSGVSSLQIEIDNTAPVFVITKPAALRENYLDRGSLSKYGSVFSVVGTIADDHSIKSMDVKVYDISSDTEVSTEPYSEEEISTTGGTSVTIARFIEESEDELARRYNEIYKLGDADSDGNKVYSCTITVSDSTKTYTEPGDEGVSGGNSTSVVYLYDDVYDEYMSTQNGAGLTANDFRSVLNGTATDKSLSGKGAYDKSLTEVKEALSAFAKDTAKSPNTRLTFSINPNADPTYSISSFGLPYEDDGDSISGSVNKAMGEQPLTIVASAGLDQVNVVPSSIKVWIKKISNQDNSVISKNTLMSEIESLVSAVKSMELTADETTDFSIVNGWKLMYDNSDDNSPTDTTVTVSTEIPGDNYIEAESYYSVVMTGHDKDGLDFSQKKLYGFKGNISAVAPSVAILTPKDGAYFANSNYDAESAKEVDYAKDSYFDADKLVFMGTALENNAGMTLKKIIATLKVTDDSSGNEIDTLSVEINGKSDYKWDSVSGFYCEYDVGAKANKWTFIPSQCEEYSKIRAESEGLMYTYTLTVKAYGAGSANLSSETSRSVKIDTKLPEVRISSISPTVSGSDYFGENHDYKDYTFLNGTITIQARISEQNLKEVSYDVWASEDLNEQLTKENSILSGLKTFLEELKEGGAEYSLDIDGSLGHKDSINETFPTEIITQYFIKLGKISGDQPIKARIVLDATDTVGNTGTYNSSDSNDGDDFFIYQETNRPRITLGNADPSVDSVEQVNINTNLFGITNNNKLAVTFQDDDSVKEYEIHIFSADGKTEVSSTRMTLTKETTSTSVNYQLPSAEGQYQLKIITRDYVSMSTDVSDENSGTDQESSTGYASVGPFFVAVDSGSPTLSLASPQNGAYVSRANSAAVSGTVSKHDVTLSGFVYAFGDEDKKPLTELKNISIAENAENDVYSWTAELPMPAKDKGDKFKLELTAEDKYQQTAVVTVTLGIDEAAPVVRLNNAEDDKESLLTNKLITELNSNYSLDKVSGGRRYLVSGVWSDEGTGTDKLYYEYADEVDEANEPVWSEVKEVSGIARSTAETSFNFYIPISEGKNFAFKVWAKDVAGNANEPVAGETMFTGLTADFALPALEKTSGDIPAYIKKDGSLVITGKFSDSYGFEENSALTVLAKMGESLVASGEKGYKLEKTLAEDKKSGTFTITLTANDENNGDWTFNVTAKDLAGRESASLVFGTKVDTLPPAWNEGLLVNKKLYSDSDSNWYNSPSLPFSGSLTEKGSGIKEILYSVIQAGSSAEPSYEDSIYTSKLADGTETFAQNLGEFIAATTSNKVCMKAVDYAGNESEPKIFSIFVDFESPSFVSTLSGTQVTNGTKDIEAGGSFDDDASGVKSVILEVSYTENNEKKFVEIEGTSSLVATINNEAKTWIYSIPGSALVADADYTVKATSEDMAGNKTSSTIFTIQKDATPPTFQSPTLSTSSVKYLVYKANASEENYYVNNKDGRFTISGVAMDNFGVEKVNLEIRGTKDGSIGEYSAEQESGVYAFSGIDLSAWTGTATAKLTVTDKAGNTNENPLILTLNFDSSVPKGIHALDEKEKDVYFRVGDNDNDDITSANSLWDNDLDKSVGGKYSAGTFGNANTVKVRGKFSDGDSGSGIKMIYYKVVSFSAEPEYSELKAMSESFLAHYKENTAEGYTGYFAPLATGKEETKRVFFTSDDGKISEKVISDGKIADKTDESGAKVYVLEASETDKVGNKYYANITTNYSSTLSGFAEGINYLILVAEDNVGNAALDTVIAGVVGADGSEATHYNASINVDTQIPTASSGQTESLYTNGSGELTLSGRVTDNAAGIRSLVITANGKEITVKDNPNGSLSLDAADTKESDGTKSRAWSATLKSSEVFKNAGDGLVSIYAVVTDNAGTGNSQSVSVGSVIVDTTPPTVTLSLPDDADSETEGTQINGTISLGGIISDANVLPETAITGIRYNTTSASLANDSEDWKDLSQVDGISLNKIGNSSFTVSGFDTTKLPDGKYYIQAVATDRAGNTGYSAGLTVIISQDSDRPKVNINNLTYDSNLGYLLKHGTDSQVTGRITDDDSTGTAVIKTLVISENSYDGNGGEAGNLATFNSSTGDFTFKPSDTTDGSKIFYIYIEDNAGKTFYSSYDAGSGATAETKYLKVPKILLNGVAQSESVSNSAFTYLSDSNNPVVFNGKGLPYSADKLLAKDSSNADFDVEKDNSNLNASFLLGGSERRYVKFNFTGSDASGIAGMILELTSSDGYSYGKYATASSITGAADLTGYVVTLGAGSFTPTEDSSVCSWTTDYIDVHSWTTGPVSVKITLYDRVGLATTSTFSFSVDNSAPSIDVSSPANGDEKTGDVTFAGSANDTGSAGTYNIQWIIPTKTEVKTASEKSSDSERLSYLKALAWNGGYSSLSESSSVTAWKFTFDGNYDKDTSDLSSYIFKAGNPKLEVYDSDTFARKVESGIYTLPLYFMATDSLGNYSIKEDFVVLHNPDGDRPVLQFSYPTTENYDPGKTFITLGGTINLTGSAEIPSNTTTVKNIYFQIASDEGKFSGNVLSATTTDDSYIAKNTYEFDIVSAYDVINAIKGTNYDTGTSFTADELKALGFSSKKDMDNWWGIAANGQASWRAPINSNGELNPSSDTNNIKVRVCGVNANGKMGAWTQGDNIISIHVDKNVPVLSEVVNQYENEITSDPNSSPSAKASQQYTADMYLKGQWYLVVDAIDESGIASVTVKNGDSTVSSYKTEISAVINDVEKSGYRVFVPIDKDVTSITYTVEATESGANPHSTKSTYSFKIDNAPPTLANVKDTNDKELSENSVNSVQNTNYVYTLKGDSVDEGSGVEHIVFYYMRKYGRTTMTSNSSANDVLFDPIAPETASYNPKIALSALTEVSIDDTDEVLYAFTADGSISASSGTNYDNFETASALDSHIREGGLVKIDGVLRKISAIDGSRKIVTFTPAATSASENTKAFFPIAQVIDASNTANSNSANPFTFDTGKDDGDLMVESFTKSGSKWTWDASIHSENMTDGPATLVIIAFDKAGNIASKKFSVMVSNNAPRIAKVFLATDLNHDNSYSENEFEAYNIGAATGNSTAGEDVYSLTTNAFNKYTLNAAGNWVKNDSTRGSFIIKNKLAILPEIVGGNGDIKLVFNNNDETTAADGKQSGSGDSLLDSSGTLTLSADLTGNSVLSGKKYWELSSVSIGGDTKTSDTTETKKMSFTFWDSTEETTIGTNSQYAFLRVNDFIVDQSDDIAPNVVVSPFFWNSASDNSLYENSSANGHIELEDDLTSTITELYGSDPKVSGKIVIRGTAYDETLLGGLTFSMTNFATDSVMASYKTGTGAGWTITNKTMESDGYKVKVEDVYMNQDGHKVNWEVAINTAAISDVAHLDAEFKVIATDQKAGGANSSENSAGTETGQTDATTHKGAYQMDVVPYVTDISSGDLESGTKKYLRRSASGAFVANVDDTTNASITVKGYNLTGGTVYLGDTAKTTVASGDALTVRKSLLTKSGSIKVINNGIETLNNINKDDAEYNKEASQFAPNHTDDRYIYMWDTTTTNYSGSEAVMKPVLNANGVKTGAMMWLYADNNQYLYADNTLLTYSWAGSVYGGNFAYNEVGIPSWIFLHNMNWASGRTTYQAYGSAQWGKKFARSVWAPNWNLTTGRQASRSTNARGQTQYTDYDETDTTAYGTARLGLGNLSFGGNTQGYSYSDSVMKRYENFKMLVSGDATDTLNMVAYFDKSESSRSIVFYRFHEGTDISQKNFALTYTKNVNTYTANSWADIGRYSEHNYSYVNGFTDGANVGLDTPAGREEITSGKADSTYFDMAYDSVMNVVYIAYYDELAGGLKIRYLNNPAAGYYGSWTNTWQTAVEIDPDAAGQYVTMITDATGRVHLAYYDSTGSYLKYALLTPSGTSGAVTGFTVTKKVLVDTLFTNGMFNSITLKDFSEDEDGSDVRPVITSYSISYGGTKYALRTSWPLTTVENIEAGATADDGYTGKWETVAVVSANAPSQDNTYTETNGTGYTGDIVVGYTASKLEQAVLLGE
ncbi:MAG: hypothetical protein IJ257_05620 [Treponema sp.]|nr:hypothetical protein [Treponema sp.]